jgi:hypothetical protein
MTHRTSILWLRAVCLLTIATGAVAWAASTTTYDEPWRLLFDVLRWPVDDVPAGFDRDARALNAVLGGVMVGWGAMMLALTWSPLADDGPGLARPLLIGVVTWYVVDSVGSFAAGLPGNVVLNTSFLVLFLPPLVSLARERA